MEVYRERQTRSGKPSPRSFLQNSSSFHRILFFAIFLLLAFEAYAGPPVEQNVLLEMKQSWKDPMLALATWIRGKSCSTWKGIKCDSSGNVIEISVKSIELSGPIASSIGNLSKLQYIDLSHDQLSGSIPSSIGNLSNLQYMSFYDNQLSGSIPSSIGNLNKLTELWFGYNRLSGPIPSSIGYLTGLLSLDFRFNQFSGPIPSSIGSLKSLTGLSIESNYFMGTFPISCSGFKYCDTSSNCFSALGNQKSFSECSSFCGTNSTSAPCSGHGTCAFDAQNNATCTCETGRSPPDCKVANENSTSLSPSSSSSSSSPPSSSSPSPSPSPSPPPSSSSSSPPSPSLSSSSSSLVPPSSSYAPSPSSYSPSKSSNRNLGLIIGIIVAIVLFLIVIAIVIFVLFKKYKKQNVNEIKSNGKFHILPRNEFQNKIQKLNFKRFSQRQIQTMTRWFDDNMTLGSGGFATVYKGILPDGEICAVKRAHRTSVRLLHDFQNEAFGIAQLNHFNIVKLLGYCDEANENILIYEYLENGSLSKMLLLPKDHPHFLNFEKRVQIAKDCAQGLNYLHNFSNKKLIHRDVKSDNILLDANFTAKIADFGLLKINDKDLSAIPTALCGTPGYIDPEYFKTLTLTNKSDVFSFGVVLLELITGKRSIFAIDDPKVPNGKLNESLVSWARPILQSSNLDELIDPNLKEEYEPTTLQSLASLAASCLRPSQKDRPGMDEVSTRLGVIMYGKASEIQEGENYTINVEDDHSEFFLSNDGNTNSSSSPISDRVPVMSRDFVAR